MERRAFSLNELTETLTTLQLRNQIPAGIDPKEAAEIILDQPRFGYVIIDNYLDNQVRTLFYKIEAAGIVECFSEFIKVSKNNYWRIHYWRLNIDQISQLARSSDTSIPQIRSVPESSA
jgi:hypothetical protein